MRKIREKLPVKSKTQLLIIGGLVLLLPLVLLQIRSQQLLRQHAAEEQKPNIIVIMTDDQRWDAMETLPTVTGRLARNGVTFTNAYVTTPLCCPSRSSFLTGLYAHNHGVWLNAPPDGGYSSFKKNEDKTIAVWLHNAGYRTGIFGKYMNSYDDGTRVAPGWDQWFVAIGSQTYYGQNMSSDGTVEKSNSSAYFTDTILSRALHFIEGTPQTRPFFLLFTPNIPHSDGAEGGNSEGMQPPPVPDRYAGRCDSISSWNTPPSFNEPDVSDKPKWVKQLTGPQKKDVEAFRKAQLCALKVVDESLQKIIASVGDRRMQNTVIIYYSDNGYSYGEHRYVKKNCLYEECARTPLIISYPKMTQGNQVNDSLVSHIDITATIADLAGVSAPVKMNGKSLVPILNGSTTKVHDAVLIEVHKQDSNDNETGAAVRTGQFAYMKYNTGEEELYDLRSDPYEMTSLHAVSAMATKKKKLADLLSQLQGDKEPAISPTVTPTGSTSPTISLTPSPTSQVTITPSPSRKPSPTVRLTPTPTPTKIPTPTPIPPKEKVEADFYVSLLLDGIGRRGDFVTPDKATLSNKNPYTKEKDVTLDIYDAGDHYLTSAYGTVEFDLRYGGYLGFVTLEEEEMPILKEYTLRLYTTNYLEQKIPGTFAIHDGDSIDLPETALVSGDVNDDNDLSILDYNLILYCYGKRIPKSCFDYGGVVGDLNEDAIVLEQDYNLFIRELNVKKTR